jgi:hypothetical protein
MIGLLNLSLFVKVCVFRFQWPVEEVMMDQGLNDAKQTSEFFNLWSKLVLVYLQVYLLVHENLAVLIV